MESNQSEDDRCGRCGSKRKDHVITSVCKKFSEMIVRKKKVRAKR